MTRFRERLHQAFPIEIEERAVHDSQPFSFHFSLNRNDDEKGLRLRDLPDPEG